MTPERERIGPVRPRPPIGASFGGRAHSHGTASDVRDQESSCVRSIAGLSADDHVQFEDEGWDSRVYVVNRGEVVFKFPRTASAQGAYANEIAIHGARRLLGLSASRLAPQAPLGRGSGLVWSGRLPDCSA